jgi:hypothetical protein
MHLHSQDDELKKLYGLMSSVLCGKCTSKSFKEGLSNIVQAYYDHKLHLTSIVNDLKCANEKLISSHTAELRKAADEKLSLMQGKSMIER